MPRSTPMMKFLLALISSKNEIEWSEIRDAIETKFVVGDWVSEVRGPLFVLIQRGQIARIDDIVHEKYRAVR